MEDIVRYNIKNKQIKTNELQQINKNASHSKSRNKTSYLHAHLY